MSAKKFAEAGFDLSRILLAAMHSQQYTDLQKLKNAGDVKDMCLTMQEMGIKPSESLENVSFRSVDHPVDGLDYMVDEREIWISPITLAVDSILINHLIKKLNVNDNPTPELIKAFTDRAMLHILLQTLPNDQVAGYMVIMANKPFCVAVIKEFYNLVDAPEVSLKNTQIRMGANTVNSILTAETVRNRIDNITWLFKTKRKELSESLFRLKTYTEVPETV